MRILSLSAAVVFTLAATAAADERPNILWLTNEDMSPNLGCFGDDYSRSPNLDALAASGVRYTNAFTVAGVCAPSRSAIITSVYPTSMGTQYMRCHGVPPSHVKCFPEYLRAAGYYCTNNSKTDYQFETPLTAWDESSGKAHWRNRRPGQPFFAVFNLTITHESQIRASRDAFDRQTRDVPAADRHDPAKAPLPPYYPDTPVVRQDVANYYDLITAMDLQMADLLRQLDEDGLAENTVVFYYSDHGWGMPRGKRWIYDSGIHIPLIIRWPGKLPAGAVDERLVSAIDFGPTALSIAGVKPPEHMHGRAFLGEFAAPEREYIYAIRDRMDERNDIIRAVRDKRYKYIRNYEPEKPYAQNINYMNEMPTMREFRRLAAAGELSGPQALFMRPTKPVEELFDTTRDPHEIDNLAADPAHAETLDRMRAAHLDWIRDTNDIGLVPEPVIAEEQRHGGAYDITAAPGVTQEPAGEGGATRLVASCATEGASIAYTADRGRATTWSLYSSPIEAEPGATYQFKACRIGYKDSTETIVMVEKTAP